MRTPTGSFVPVKRFAVNKRETASAIDSSPAPRAVAHWEQPARVAADDQPRQVRADEADEPDRSADRHGRSRDE